MSFTFAKISIKKYIRGHLSLPLALKLFVILLELKLLNKIIIKNGPSSGTDPVEIQIMAPLYPFALMANNPNKLITHKLPQNSLCGQFLPYLTIDMIKSIYMNNHHFGPRVKDMLHQAGTRTKAFRALVVEQGRLGVLGQDRGMGDCVDVSMRSWRN